MASIKLLLLVPILCQVNLIFGYTEGTVEFCMFEYPYTYSKCLSLCNETAEPACVSDSMCICDVNNMQVDSGKMEFLDPRTTCMKTAYCDISCREKAMNGKYFKEGKLCERDSRSSCVCLF